MTPEESREMFLDTMFSKRDLDSLKESGIYYQYTEGKVSVDKVYAQLKEQGV